MNLKRMIFFLTLVIFACLLSACASDESPPADSSWKAASTLVTNARYPTIGSDGNGNLITVWEQPEGIYSACFDSHTGWGVPQKIMENTVPYVFRFRDIHLAVNAKGDAVVAWIREDYPNYFIQTIRYSAGSGWDTPQQLTPPNTVYSFDLALDANSNAIITWTGMDSPVVRLTVFASRSMPSSEWDVPQMIGTNIWDATYPRIAIDNIGNAFVLWVEGEFSSNNVYVNRYTINSGWGTPQQIATNVSSALLTNISFDETGNAMAVWAQQDLTNRAHIYSCMYVAGSGWGGTAVVDSNTLDSIEPALTVENSGSFRAVWVQYTGVGNDIYSSRFSLATGWEAPLLIGTGGNARSPRVSVDGADNVFATWQQYDPNDIYAGDAKIYANRYTAGSGWGLQTKLTNALGGAEAPGLTVDPQGHATAIWSQGSVTLPGTTDIFTSRFQ